MLATRMWVAALALATGAAASGGGAAEEAHCPGRFVMKGLGNVSIIPSGWGAGGPFPVMHGNGVIEATMGSRSYFAATCTAGKYDNEQYLALDFRGKTLTYTTDLSSAGCGCNAALYLTSMRQNADASECGDHYCDANNVCGLSCAEIDIQEGNMFAWHSTLHSATDNAGLGRGYGGGGEGWNGPREWKPEDYGPHARCIDTTIPFQVSAYFPVDAQGTSTGMEITLTQHGKDCPLWTRLDGYSDMGALDRALAQGMTPIVSYWRSKDMVWMDGKGKDGQGPCWEDLPDDCSASVRFYDIAVRPEFPATTTPPPTTPEPAVVLLPSQRGGEGSSQPLIKPAMARAFFAGAFSLLGMQALCVFVVWGVRSAAASRGQNGCPVGPVVSPLRRALAGSGQSLMMLAEIGGAGQAAESGENSPATPRTSREVNMVPRQ